MAEPFETYIQKLEDISPKAARAFRSSGEEFYRDLPSDAFLAWFNLGLVISYSSSAGGIKYFGESGERIRTLQLHPNLTPLLNAGIRIGLAAGPLALEFFRQIPGLIHDHSAETIIRWGEAGITVGNEDYLSGTEFFKAGPEVLYRLSPERALEWGKIGVVLSRFDTQNRSVHAVEFFRTTPVLFKQVPREEDLQQILVLAHALSFETPGEVTHCLQAAVSLINRGDIRHLLPVIFSLASEIVFSVPQVLVDFLVHAPDLHHMMGSGPEALREFVEGGLRLKASRQGVKSYFELKSKRALEMIRSLTPVVYLSDVRTRLTYVAEMMIGAPVEVRAGALPGGRRLDGKGIITLPERIGLFPDRENNERLYRFMLLHEAAHFEFGSYEGLLPGTLDAIRSQFPRSEPREAENPPFWELFPDPSLAQKLWTLAEESRIDYLVRRAYPGAIREFHFILDIQKDNRPDLFTLPGTEGILEALFQLSFHEEIVIPLPIANTVSILYATLKKLWKSGATVQDTVRITGELYRILLGSDTPPLDQSRKPEIVEPPESALLYGIFPPSAFSHHGLVDPGSSFQSSPAPAGSELSGESAENSAREHSSGDARMPSGFAGEPDASRTGEGESAEGPVFFYDEWDSVGQDYRPSWCRVIEQEIETSGSRPGADNSTRGSIRAIRRYFEKLRPENYRKLRNQMDGDEIDLDRFIERVADCRAGNAPDDRFYIQRVKKERKISVSFLIDLSGSTGQKIVTGGKRIIDIEIESLRMMTAALDAVGDDYGIYGFSGESRNRVSVYPIKAFDSANGSEMTSKLLGLKPLNQNRDGAAIRHVTGKLAGREANIRLLIVMSDGKPLDAEYEDHYALEDTRMALNEAKQKGIHPFCITVDRNASDYIRKMYQDIQYLYISDIESLPVKLPLIYKKLTT